MLISSATSYELEVICQIDYAVIGNDSRTSYLSKAITDGKCLVARANDSVVGFVIYDTSFYEHAFIWLVMVSPEFRRRGVAKALINHIASICPTEKLFTSTNESNEAMIKLCQSLGFIQSGRIDNLDEGDPEIIYFKRVNNKPTSC